MTISNGTITAIDEYGNTILIKAPNESSAWNITPATWTTSETTNSEEVFNSTTVDRDTKRNGRKTTETTNTTTTNKVVATSETQISETTVSSASTTKSAIIPYMRRKRILFKSTGLKPNVGLTAVFADQDVTEYCKQTSVDNPIGKLVASPVGTIEGYFDMPGNTFKTGERKFVLHDSIDANISNAETIYTAKGTRNDTYITNRFDKVTTVQKTINETSTVSIKTNIRVRYGDPVAQSFFVDTAETKDGVFVHSIDLFFYEIDPEHEVMIELRKMKNGAPTLDLISPHAWTKLLPKDIKAADNASKSSRFIFPAPVFLPSNEEYCFVVLSNSDKSSIWCSQLGRKSYKVTDTTEPTGEIISKQPYLGTMFVSQNNSTWDAEQQKDLKFTINKCKFNTNVASIACINSAEDDIYNFPNKKVLKPNSLEFKSGSTEVTINAYGHGLFSGDTFKLHFGADILDNLFGIPRSELEDTELTVTSTTPTKIKFASSTTATATGSSGGSSMWMDGWVIGYSYAQLIKNDFVLDNTEVSYTFSGRQQSNYNSGAIGNIPIIADKIMDLKNIYAVKSDNDEGAKITATLKTNDSNLSPIITANNIGMEVHMNIINNLDYKDAENTLIADASPARYIQKEVNLLNPANELKVFLESSMPFGTNISVYYKTGNTQIAENAEWLLLSPDTSLVFSDSPEDWRTQKFTKTFDTTWNVFKVMIVLSSDSRLIIPRVKNYRAIALNV